MWLVNVWNFTIKQGQHQVLLCGMLPYTKQMKSMRLIEVWYFTSKSQQHEVLLCFFFLHANRWRACGWLKFDILTLKSDNIKCGLLFFLTPQTGEEHVVGWNLPMFWNAFQTVYSHGTSTRAYFAALYEIEREHSRTAVENVCRWNADGYHSRSS